MQPFGRPRSIVAACVTSALLAGGLGAAGISAASAQEVQRRPWSLFDIFRPKPRRYYIVPEEQPPALARPKKKARAAPSLPPEPEVEAVEKKPDARAVLVIEALPPRSTADATGPRRRSR